MAFTISTAAAGLGGHLFSFFQGFINPEAFEFESSVFFLTIVILGGAGTLGGPLVAAPIIVFLPELLQRFIDHHLIIYGALIVAFLYALPLGIVGTQFRRRSADAAVAPAPIESDEPALRPAQTAREANELGSVLELDGVRMSFGGVSAQRH